MLLLNEDARLVCIHPGGEVTLNPRQSWVTIGQRRVLVATDPQGCAITKCANVAYPNKPCLNTLAVETGYSSFIRIDGRPVCLETVTGLTDGTVMGTVKYSVASAGQRFVNGAG
jgi:hypothetical protein